jgi:hypothetical protein
MAGLEEMEFPQIAILENTTMNLTGCAARVAGEIAKEGAVRLQFPLAGSAIARIVILGVVVFTVLNRNNSLRERL